MSNHNCNVCGHDGLQEITDFRVIQRVTSDCVPFRSGGKIACCLNCGAVQKYADDIWLSEINEIYRSYSPYHQADGEEQIVFDAESGMPQKRSAVLLKWIKQSIIPGNYGKVLDVGCGNGATLRAFSENLSGWDLYGYELGARGVDVLNRIPAFRQLHTGELSEINGKFDLISLVHSLEHFVNPFDIVVKIGDLLSDQGWIFIEVCNVLENPFDLIIADHLMHFSPRTLEILLSRAGLEIVHVSTNRVKKEISMLARKRKGSAALRDLRRDIDVVAECQHVVSCISWLNACAEIAGLEAKIPGRRFGIFGTSIAATWLATHLNGMVSFFVDEDANRTGKTYMNLPVLSPQQVPSESVVYLALVPELADLINSRLAAHGISTLLPPPIPQGHSRALS